MGASDRSSGNAVFSADESERVDSVRSNLDKGSMRGRPLDTHSPASRWPRLLEERPSHRPSHRLSLRVESSGIEELVDGGGGALAFERSLTMGAMMRAHWALERSRACACAATAALKGLWLGCGCSRHSSK